MLLSVVHFFRPAPTCRCCSSLQNFYIEHPDVSKRTDDETTKWRQSCGIVIQGDGIPKPAMTFEEASMPEYVLKEVMKQGFERPTPIQSQGWPMALLGRDMVGISATGSGKTLAFLLPAMIHINAQVWHDICFPLPSSSSTLEASHEMDSHVLVPCLRLETSVPTWETALGEENVVPQRYVCYVTSRFLPP